MASLNTTQLIMLGYGMCLMPMQQHRHRLSLEQKQILKFMLKQKMLVKHSEIPEAVRGIEGMRIADEILKTRNAVGILIGGLACEVWSQKRKPEDLAAHKDVDVVVLTKNFKLNEKFEGGIDWWLKRNEVVDVIDQYGQKASDIPVQWYENGYNCILKYYPEIDISEPGLYIPADDEVVEMQKAFCEYQLNFVESHDISVDYDCDIEEALIANIRKKVKTRLPRFIREEFGTRVIRPRIHEMSSFEVQAAGQGQEKKDPTT